MFYSQPIDMQKSSDSLCVLITKILKRNRMDGMLFLFRNRDGNKLKALYYEENCFTILQSLETNLNKLPLLDAISTALPGEELAARPQPAP